MKTEPNHRANGQRVEFASDIVAEVNTYTAAHQRRVARLARAIGEEMALPQEGLDTLCHAARIHDLGKIRMGYILVKTGRLSDEERALIQTHVERGYKLLKKHFSCWEVPNIVRQHHERLDGSGYPDGISGEDLTGAARILGVADVVEAMATHRPYRPALGIDAAIGEVTQGAGRLYDAKVVDACVKVCKENGFKFEEEERDGETEVGATSRKTLSCQKPHGGVDSD